MADDLLGLKVEGLTEAERQVARLAAQLLDLRTFWPKLVPLFISWVSRTFDSEGGFIGDLWAPLSPDYAQWKDAHYPGKKILSLEGPLRRAATSPERRATPRVLELVIGEYERDDRVMDPVWFQEGTSDMPARPLLAERPTAQMEMEAAAVGEQHARELVRLLGLRN